MGDAALGDGYSGTITIESGRDYDVIAGDKSVTCFEVQISYSLSINDVISMKMALISFIVSLCKVGLYGNVCICVMVPSM